MTKIIMTRHGHVEGIEPERFRGRENLPLTSRGRAEAQAVAERIASAWRPGAIYTSPLERCIVTGAAISKACHVAAHVLAELNDIDYGAWQFKTYREIQQTNSERFAAWFAAPHLVRFPNGESLQDLLARTSDALRLILARHADDIVVIVGHDSVNRALLLQLLDQPLSAYWRIAQHPCCLNEIDVVGGRVRVLRINETRHLDGLEKS